MEIKWKYEIKKEIKNQIYISEKKLNSNTKQRKKEHNKNHIEHIDTNRTI